MLNYAGLINAPKPTRVLVLHRITVIEILGGQTPNLRVYDDNLAV